MTRALLALLLSALPAWAAPPKVPEKVEVPVGEDTVLTIEVAADDAFGMAPGFDPKDCTFFEGVLRGGKKQFLVRPKRAGTFYVTWWTKGETAFSQTVITTAGGPTPPGPTPPGPGPLPDGKLGLVKASRDGKAAAVADPAGARKLADAQRSIASTIAAGGLAKPADILAAWRDANKAAVDADAWKPWGAAVSAKLGELYAAGKLPDKAAWVAAFTEVAEGLE